MKGFDYADKKKKLLFGPLPWPTGLPAPGYVPKTNPLNGRWEVDREWHVFSSGCKDPATTAAVDDLTSGSGLWGLACGV